MIAKLSGATFGAAILLSSALAYAQTATIPAAYGPPVTLEAAKKVMAAAEAEAKKNNWLMAITILDSGGNMVAMHRFDNSQLGSIGISEGKARTAVNLRNSTKALQETFTAGGASTMRLLSVPDVIIAGGGEVLISGAQVIGSIGVSGGTPDQDAQVARAGAAVLQ